MRLVNWLFSRAPTPAMSAPLILREGLKAHDEPEFVASADLAEADELQPHPEPPEETIQAAPSAASALSDYFCVIEYCSADGVVTRRRVTFRSCRPSDGGLLISAVCHERRAPRSFRADRIRCIIDQDGVVHDAFPFLTGTLGIDMEGYRRQQSTQAGARLIRQALGAELKILVAAAQADAHFHRDELDRIEIFVEREVPRLIRAKLLPDTIGIEELDGLRPIIYGLRPLRSSLPKCLGSIVSLDAQRLERFNRALNEVICADGRVADEEIELADWVSDYEAQRGIAGRIL